MIDMNVWLAESEALAEAPKAVRAWNHINDKPTSVVFKKPDGTVLSAQTVRLETDGRQVLEKASAAGQAPQRGLIVYGVVNHPDSAVVDTDMSEGYRFVSGNDEYRIIDVIQVLGELQGVAEAVG